MLPMLQASNAASALFLAMIFCLRVYNVNLRLPNSTTPAPEDVRVSLSPAQSESK